MISYNETFEHLRQKQNLLERQTSYDEVLKKENELLKEIIKKIIKENEKLKEELSDCIMSNELLEKEYNGLMNELKERK